MINLLMGKRRAGAVPACLLEDACSLDRGSTFSAICQGYLRRAKQWSSHSHADSGRGPTLGSSLKTHIQVPCLFEHIVLGSIGTAFSSTVIKFSLLFVSFIDVI